MSSSAHNRPLPHNETGGDCHPNFVVCHPLEALGKCPICRQPIKRQPIPEANNDSTAPVPKEAEEEYCDWLRERDRLQDLHDQEERAWAEQDELQRLTDG